LVLGQSTIGIVGIFKQADMQGWALPGDMWVWVFGQAGFDFTCSVLCRLGLYLLTMSW
jgi:hypothetical protein